MSPLALHLESQKRNFKKTIIDLCFLTRILMLGWVETEDDRERILHFSKKVGAEKMSLHRRRCELVGRNVICKARQGKALNENPQNLNSS